VIAVLKQDVVGRVPLLHAAQADRDHVGPAWRLTVFGRSHAHHKHFVARIRCGHAGFDKRIEDAQLAGELELARGAYRAGDGHPFALDGLEFDAHLRVADPVALEPRAEIRFELGGRESGRLEPAEKGIGDHPVGIDRELPREVRHAQNRDGQIVARDDPRCARLLGQRRRGYRHEDAREQAGARGLSSHT
jgi:hypothetical protein